MKISQNEARRLRKRVNDLEERIRSQQSSWTSDWPSGKHLFHLTRPDADQWFRCLVTARQLGFALVATTDDTNRIHFFAVPVART